MTRKPSAGGTIFSAGASFGAQTSQISSVRRESALAHGDRKTHLIEKVCSTTIGRIAMMPMTGNRKMTRSDIFVQ
jgi:hypothetical protein